MQRAVVGLDIGTTSVRAAGLSWVKDRPVLDKIGQVALPSGAVRDGEVVDSDAVVAALRQLWSATGFATKKVVLGVANQKVIVRQVEVPWLPQNEFRSALPLQVQDHIPMPTDEAILDYHLLEEFETDSGARMLRILLVAGAKDMVNSLVDCATRAGLSPVMVDLTPFALLRSLGRLDELGLENNGAEALVDVGASVTNIVVHEGGVPRFVRILMMGGADITDALADRMGVATDQAESLKQQIGMPVEPGAVAVDSPSADRVIESRGSALVEEIRGSLDYYRSQPNAARIARVVVSGGGAQLIGLTGRLMKVTHLPVESGMPFSSLAMGRKIGLTDSQLAYVEPLAGAPVGLAMGAHA